MTSLKCARCVKYFTVHTLFPDQFTAITRWCPECIPFSLPSLKLEPLRRIR